MDKRPASPRAQYPMKKDVTQVCEEKIKQLDKIIGGFAGEFELSSYPPREKEKMLKKRNALYSQRKYYRRKLTESKLQRQIDDLTGKNKKVRKQNEYFDKLLSRAMDEILLQEIGEKKPPALDQPMVPQDYSTPRYGADTSELLSALRRAEMEKGLMLMNSTQSPEEDQNGHLRRLLLDRQGIADLPLGAVVGGTIDPSRLLLPSRLVANESLSPFIPDSLQDLSRLSNQRDSAALPLYYNTEQSLATLSDAILPQNRELDALLTRRLGTQTEAELLAPSVSDELALAALQRLVDHKNYNNAFLPLHSTHTGAVTDAARLPPFSSFQVLQSRWHDIARRNSIDNRDPAQHLPFTNNAAQGPAAGLQSDHMLNEQAVSRASELTTDQLLLELARRCNTERFNRP